MGEVTFAIKTIVSGPVGIYGWLRDAPNPDMVSKLGLDEKFDIFSSQCR